MTSIINFMVYKSIRDSILTIQYMAMKRIQLFEFEDFSWFPGWLRTALTNLIVVMHKLMGVGEVLADLVVGVIKKKGLNHIADLGSGAGGAMPDVFKIIHEEHGMTDIKLTMTDLYPNQDALLEGLETEDYT